ncbi:MAG: SAM-dependent methyltransferase [Hungatella sp.]
MELMEQLKQNLEYYLNEQLMQIVCSNSVEKEKLSKVKVRPIRLQNQLLFQIEEFCGKKVFHQNRSKEDTVNYLSDLLQTSFKQLELISGLGSLHVLVSKKGKMTIKSQKHSQPKILANPQELNHNRQKRYIIEEGKPVPFLEDLGVMTADGTVVRSKYNKFKQINRFLEFIEDILPKLSRERELTILDFGCGKSYLTFAMYYYLKELKGYTVRIIGLDLKQDVIDRCNELSTRYGFDHLHFYHGDIAAYEGVSQVDMVVTLHACDTATDYALAKAIQWGAAVILSVPCCQHELNGQIENELLKPILQYGLIKERMAALYTDALRAELLESQGYRTQILEFIDMEHTPKNILIRAVKEGAPKDNQKELSELMQFLHADLTLARLCHSINGEPKIW